MNWCESETVYIYPVPRFAHVTLHVTAARFIRRLTRKPKREATRPARGRRVREPPCTRRRDPRAAADMRPRGGRGATKGKGATRAAPGANSRIRLPKKGAIHSRLGIANHSGGVGP